MPIKAENRHRYPADWPAIRERILTRAGNYCEHPDCGARNYDVGFWRKQMGRFVWHEQVRGLRTWREASQWAAELYFDAGEEGPKPTVIVLTIAHLDHQNLPAARNCYQRAAKLGLTDAQIQSLQIDGSLALLGTELSSDIPR